MKKVFINIVLILIGFLIYFLQANFFKWFTIAGIKPNLFIILSLIIGIFIGKAYGVSISIFLGLILDLFIGRAIGINAIVLAVAGFFGGILTKRFSKDSRMTIMLMTIGTTIICETIYYFLQIIIFKLSVEFVSFIKIVLIETLYNVMLVIIIYPLIIKLGELLERIFTEKNILTKYY